MDLFFISCRNGAMPKNIIKVREKAREQLKNKEAKNASG